MTADGRPVSYLGRGVGRKEMERLTAALGGPLPSWTDEWQGPRDSLRDGSREQGVTQSPVSSTCLPPRWEVVQHFSGVLARTEAVCFNITFVSGAFPVPHLAVPPICP